MDSKLYIRNMVCNRCIMVVKSELEKLGLNPVSVSLGEVEFHSPVSEEKKEAISQAIEPLGFSIISERKSRIIERVKTLIIELIHQKNGELRTNLSDYLADELRHDYKSISQLFSEVEGTTIEQYYIAQRIERVKELLVYGEMSLSEITHLMNYSSVAHLSNQFKKVTGLTPGFFRNIQGKKRRPLDEV